MKVKMLVGLAGPLFSLSPGDECEFPDDEAIRLIDAEFAVATKAIETADARPASERRAKKGKPDVVSTEGDDATVGGADLANGSEEAS